MDEKKQLRAMMMRQLSNLTNDTYNDYCNKIKEKLLAHPLWNDATTVGITISRGKEVETRAIIEAGWALGKTICVPKCIPKEKKLNFRSITSFKQLEESYYDLLEPIVDETRSVEPAEMDVVIVPGLLFDRCGFRIGFGGGYYDRYLTEYSGPTLSLAFQIQMVEKIPREAFDMPVDTIITDEQVHHTAAIS